MFKKQYMVRRSQWMNTITFSEVKFKFIMWVKCLDEGRDPKQFCADVWKTVGNKSYTWTLANETLDVNAPPHCRYDLYRCSKDESPDLCASIFENEGTYHCYQYDRESELLSFLTESDSLEDAKACIELITIME